MYVLPQAASRCTAEGGGKDWRIDVGLNLSATLQSNSSGGIPRGAPWRVDISLSSVEINLGILCGKAGERDSKRVFEHACDVRRVVAHGKVIESRMYPTTRHPGCRPRVRNPGHIARSRLKAAPVSTKLTEVWSAVERG